MIFEKEKILIEEFLAGSELAFNELARKYQPVIYAHCRRMLGNHMDADEVTQEVLIVLYNKLNTFQFKSSLSTWIYRVTTTRSLNFIKKKSLRKFLFLDDDEARVLHSGDDVANDYENKTRLENLDRVLQKIPVKQREVFILRHFEELTYEEISEITGKSTGGLKANYFHALKKVTELMEDEK